MNKHTITPQQWEAYRGKARRIDRSDDKPSAFYVVVAELPGVFGFTNREMVGVYDDPTDAYAAAYAMRGNVDIYETDAINKHLTFEIAEDERPTLPGFESD